MGLPGPVARRDDGPTPSTPNRGNSSRSPTARRSRRGAPRGNSSHVVAVDRATLAQERRAVWEVSDRTKCRASSRWDLIDTSLVRLDALYARPSVRFEAVFSAVARTASPLLVERVSTLARKAVLSGLVLALMVVQKRLDSTVPAPLGISPTRLAFVGKRRRRWSLEPCHDACHGPQPCQQPCHDSTCIGRAKLIRRPSSAQPS